MGPRLVKRLGQLVVLLTAATLLSITLRITNSRDAIWSAACSSGGNKTKTCTFTLTGNAAVTANVQ
jgi:hypothetical protein